MLVPGSVNVSKCTSAMDPMGMEFHVDLQFVCLICMLIFFCHGRDLDWGIVVWVPFLSRRAIPAKKINLRSVDWQFYPFLTIGLLAMGIVWLPLSKKKCLGMLKDNLGGRSEIVNMCEEVAKERWGEIEADWNLRKNTTILNITKMFPSWTWYLNLNALAGH